MIADTATHPASREALRTRSFLRANRMLAGDLRYLSQNALLQERYMPRIVRLTMITVSLSILCFLVWAMLTEVNEVARAQGDVVPDGYLQTVQHLEGGIVADILVDEGQLVQKGQVLIRINGDDSLRDMQEVQVEQLALQVQAERLRAFIDDREPDFAGIERAGPAMIEEQKRMFDEMLLSREREAEVIAAQVEQKKQSLAAFKAKLNALGNRMALVRQEVEMQEGLMEQGLTSKLRYIDRKKELALVNGEYAETQNRVREAEQSIGEYENRLKSLNAKHRDEAYRQLEVVQSTVSQNGETLAKRQNRMERLDVRAPVDGFVKGLSINTVGGVVAPGQTLMQIVPLDAPLVVEARISPRDIGHVSVGKPVQVKVHAFDYTRYGVVEGVVEFISATTFVDERSQSYYRGRVRLQQNFVGTDKMNNIVLPGMTVDAEIVTGRKSVLDYLLKPIQAASSTAFTER